MPEEAVMSQLDIYPDEAFKEMVDAGVFYGRKKSKTNPRMKPFIFGNRNGIEIIDLTKTTVGLLKATEFIKEKVAKREDMILCVGTQPAAHDMKEALGEFNFPYVSGRWIGGTLTNHKTIFSRVERLKQLRMEREKGMHDKYTKKERVLLDREMNRLEIIVGSIENLSRLPDMLLVVDSKVHETAIREAHRMKVPIVALDNTDANPDHANYSVVGNNASRKSVVWFLEKMRDAVREGKSKQSPVAEPVKVGDN